MARYFLNLLLLCFFIGIYVSSNVLLQNYRLHPSRTINQAASLWTMPPVVLKVLAGEFKGLISDLIVLDVGAQLGTHVLRTKEGDYKAINKKQHWPSIYKLFTNSQALDPSFQQTYMLAQGWLPWDADMIDETKVILKTAEKNRPCDWRPLHFIGFNTYYFLNNVGEAGKIFIEAGKTPNAPPFLAIVGARLAQKGGETQAAIVLMKSMLKDKQQNNPDYNRIMDRLNALEGVLVLEIAVDNYKNTFQRYPDNLDELLKVGLLKALPGNPYNVEYCIDSAGMIYFDKPDC